MRSTVWLVLVLLIVQSIPPNLAKELPKVKSDTGNADEVLFTDSEENLTIENPFLLLELSKKTGRIVWMYNKITQHHYLDEDSKGPFRIYYDSMSRSIWQDTNAYVVFEASDQQVKHYSTENLQDNGKVLTVEYDHLISDGRAYAISVKYSIRVYPNSPETLWGMQIANEELGTVKKLDFPFFEGITAFDSEELANYLLIPTCSGEKIADPLNRFARDQSVVLEYPAMGSMQWMELGNPMEGLYLASLDKSISYTELYFGKDGETPSMTISKFPFLAPGSEWVSHPYAVGIHAGDWHWSADRYREWLESWLRKPLVPKWVQELPAIHWTQVVLPQNKLARTFADLPSLFDKLQSSLGRPPVLYVHGWWEGGFDTKIPEYVVSGKAGGEDALRNAIDYIQSRGGKVVLYFNGRLTDTTTETYKVHSHSWSAINAQGGEYYEKYGTLNAVVNCPGVQEWRNALLEYTLNASREFGMDGMQYDQVGCAWARLCYSPSHDHSTPAMAWAEYTSFLRFHREAQNALNEDFFYGTEELVDVFTPYFNWGFDWMGNSPQLGLFPFLRSRVGEYFPELARYTMPWHITSGPWNFEGMPFNMNAYNFILGKRFNYGDDEASISSIMPYIKMYDAAKDAFYYGRFMDDVGLMIEQSNGSEVLGKIHVGEKSVVLAVWNRGHENVSSIRIRIDLSELGLDREVGSVVNLGAELGLRRDCVNLPFTIKDSILEFEFFSLEAQEAVAIGILPTKNPEGDLEIQSLLLSKSKIVKGENLEIDVTLRDSSTENLVTGANVTAFIQGSFFKGDEVENGVYKILVETRQFDLGITRLVVVADKEGYDSDSKEAYLTLEEGPPFPYHLVIMAVFTAVVLVYLSRRWRASSRKTGCLRASVL